MNYTELYSIAVHGVMVLVALYAVYLAFCFHQRKKQFLNEQRHYLDAIDGNPHTLIDAFIEQRDFMPNKQMVTTFYDKYSHLYPVDTLQLQSVTKKGSSTFSTRESETYQQGLQALSQALKTPEVLTDYVSKLFRRDYERFADLAGLGTSLGMLFTITSFVLMGYSQDSSTTMTSSLTALTSTGIGTVISLFSESQRKKVSNVVMEAQELIELFLHHTRN